MLFIHEVQHRDQYSAHGPEKLSAISVWHLQTADWKLVLKLTVQSAADSQQISYTGLQ